MRLGPIALRAGAVRRRAADGSGVSERREVSADEAERRRLVAPAQPRTENPAVFRNRISHTDTISGSRRWRQVGRPRRWRMPSSFRRKSRLNDLTGLDDDQRVSRRSERAPPDTYSRRRRRHGCSGVFATLRPAALRCRSRWLSPDRPVPASGARAGSSPRFHPSRAPALETAGGRPKLQDRRSRTRC